MGMGVLGARGSVLAEMNVVPLIDILLVMLVTFMIIPHRQRGLDAVLPQQSAPQAPELRAETIVVQVAGDGAIRVNGTDIKLDELRGSLERIFALRSQRVAFLQGDGSIEFQAVAEVLDLMHVSGVSTVGLLTSELEKNR
jgi:biopolymer transport protein TolR